MTHRFNQLKPFGYAVTATLAAHLIAGCATATAPDAADGFHTEIVVETGGGLTAGASSNGEVPPGGGPPGDGAAGGLRCDEEVQPSVVRELIDTIEAGLLPVGASVYVLVLDGPNARSSERIDLADLDVNGRLGNANNDTARKAEIDKLAPQLAIFACDVFADASDLSTGRDLRGAIERAAEPDRGRLPDRVVLITTSGGIQRTEAENWTDPTEIGEFSLDIEPGIDVVLIGIGIVPAADGVAAKELTEPLRKAWRNSCASYGTCTERKS